MSAKPVLQVNIHDAKTNLSRYLARVEAGETIMIARAGKPVARLVPEATAEVKPEEGQKYPSILGAKKGQWKYDEAVDRELDKEIEEMFIQTIEKPW
jgi:prevent-host-death family protein